VRLLPHELLFDPQRLVAALSAKTRIVNVSHVSFQSGLRVDLLSLGRHLREREIIFVVDATQSLGGLTISSQELENIDVLACSTYKWLLCPYGTAFAYWAPRVQPMVRPLQAGWLSMPQAPHRLTEYAEEWREGACRFDRGQAPNLLVNTAVHASLSLFHELGLKTIEDYNQQLVRTFLDSLAGTKILVGQGGGLPSNILSVGVAGADPASLQARLRDANIDVSVREGNLRVSFHFFNSKAQVFRLIEMLRA
jgi:selenocysteine lyase/cysteine desulfurase